MRIDGDEGDHLPASPRVTLLSPSTSSAASSTATDDMVEAENQNLRERVQELEKKVLDQTDELTCLRSTLADALRRLANMEATNRDHNSTVSSPSNGGGSRIAAPRVKMRLGVSERARDPNRRATSYIPGRTPTGKRSLHQSSSSLYSDGGHSSSSASPAPSPSPTHITTSHTTRSSTSHTSQFISRTTSSTLSKSLNKRWNSTLDFSSNGSTSTELQIHHSSTSNGGLNGSSPSTRHSPSPLSTSNLSRRLNGGGSMHNLSNLRLSAAPTPPLKQSRREPLYLTDEGVVRVYIRGRPVTFYVPSHLRATYTAATPAPAPPYKLHLDWVYGYRGRDCRNNLQLLPTGELLYFVAAVAVLYNVQDQMQRHYTGHTDDIKCLSVHPNKMLVATGQTAGNNRPDTRSWRLNAPVDMCHQSAERWPHIRVWDSVSLNTLHIIGISDFERSVACLAFSRADGGTLLVAVDDASDHNMSVWDWARGERGHKLIESKCSSDPVLSVEFSPVDRHTIITCGRSNITFWSYENGMLAKRLGVFESSREKPKYVTAIAFLSTGDVLSGDSNGNLLIWYRGGNTVAHSVRKAHDGPVFSILVLSNGNIVTAGKDGKIYEWDSNLNRTGQSIKVLEKYGSPRVVTTGKGSRLMVGTTRNCLLGGSFSLQLEPMMLGHFDEVWGLSCHPSQQQFLTGGYDKSCVLWDSMSHTQVWATAFAEQVQCGVFSPCGGVVVVGGVSGYWAAMDAQTRELRQENRDGSHPIQVVRFSPDGQYLAIGSRDGNIYIYQVQDNITRFARLGRCQGHSTAVLHLDWSTDSQYIQSNSTDYDLCFWNAGICRQIVQAGQLRDVQWATHTCPVSFNSMGTWQDDGVDVLSSCQANKTDVIAAGDLIGNITLLASPACHQKASGVIHGGHGSLVTGVEFLPDDTRLISCGSRDGAVMQWQLIERH